MYTQIWIKYLPIIKILLKKSASADQTLSLNVTDFERAGLARKSGHKFALHFSNGRIENVVIASPLAKDLATTLLQDSVVNGLFAANDYHISMNAKYQLSIKFIAKEAVASEAFAEAPENGNEN